MQLYWQLLNMFSVKGDLICQRNIFKKGGVSGFKVFFIINQIMKIDYINEELKTGED